MKKLWLLWALCWWSNILFAQQDSSSAYILNLEHKIYLLTSEGPSSKNIINQLYLQLADSAITKQNWNAANEALKKVDDELLNDEMLDSYYYKNAYVAAAQGKFQKSFEELIKIEHKSTSAKTLACVSACMLLDTAYLFAYAAELKPLLSDSIIKEWRSSFPPEKNTKAAVILSAIIPGAGSFYAHNNKHALTTLIGCGIAAIGSIYLIRQDYYIIPLVAGLGLFTRFYAGGLKNAKIDTEKRNDLLIKRWQEKICSVLLQYPIQTHLN